MSGITPITYTIGASGIGASITAGSLPAGVTGTYNAGVFTISGTPTAAGNFSYTITTSGPCANPSLSGTITVLAAPTGTLTSSATTICAGQSITFTAPPGYSLYTFYVNGTIAQNASASNVFNISTLNDQDVVAVQVFNSLSCASYLNSITINVKALPVATLSADKTSPICAGDTVKFTAAPTGTGFTYNFKVNGVSQLSGASNTYTTTTLTNGQTVTVDVTNANGCVGTSTAITYTVNPLPNGTLTTNMATTVCANAASVTFQATGGTTGALSYQFRVDGTIIQPWSASSTFTHTFTDDGLVTVDVATAANGGGCTKTYDGIPVTVNPIPTGSISVTENSGAQNNNEICQGSLVTYTFSKTGYNYVWKINGTPQTGSGNVFTTTGLAANDHVSVVVTTVNGCSDTFNATDVNVVAAPAAVLTVSKNAICLNDNATFTSTPFDATFNYNFKVDGTTAQNGSGINANIFSTTALLAGNHNVLVEVTNGIGCITTSNTTAITVSPLPTSTLTAVENYGTANDGEICEGGTVVFTVPAGFSNYNFLLKGNSVQNGSSNTYTTSTLSDGNDVTVAITNAGGCIGVLNTIIIKVNPLPVVDLIGGPGNVCKGSMITLTDATVATLPNTTGVWSSGNTAFATVNAATGEVTGVAPGDVVISYTYTNENGCSSSATKTITVKALPVVDPITGNFNICKGFSTVLADGTNTGGAFVWSSSNTAVADVDPTGIVSGNSSGSAVISYTFTDANTGCSSTVTATVVVTNQPEVKPIATTAPAGFNACVGGTLQLTDATSGGTWKSLDPAVATISASGLITGVSAGTVDITYSILTSCGEPAADTITITVNAKPSAAIAYGASPSCTNGGQITVTQTGTTGGQYSIAPTGTATIDPSTGKITPGSTGGTYTVTYTVAAAGGCAVYTTTTQVIITTNPTITGFTYSASPYCSTVNSASPNLVASSTGGTFSYTATAVARL